MKPLVCCKSLQPVCTDSKAAVMYC